MKKTTFFISVMIAMLCLLPQVTVFAGAEELAGKTVSILSHSASTYAGVSNNTADNSTIGKNDVYYTAGRHGVYREDTWWQQAADALGLRLLVNNSWSGSCVFQPRKGAASVGYGERAVNLHNDHTGEEPDIIWVYLGCNDFAYYKDTFGTAEAVDDSALIQDSGNGTFAYALPQTACEAYTIMLHKVRHRYPEAEIYCMTSTARRDPDYAGDSQPDTGQPTAYSAELQKVARKFGFPVIDLETCIPKEAEFFDLYMGDKRAHPNALGMDQITNEVLSVMLGRESEIRHVTSEQGIVAEQAVLLGGSYRAEADVPEGHSVSVIMDGTDITDKAYEDGIITIDEVTGDIAVTTAITRAPMNFSWELVDGELISTGEDENPLSMLAGTITDGVINNGRYELTTSVILKHDRPWALEWKCGGDWRGIVLSPDLPQKAVGRYYLARTVGGQLCFGAWTGKQHDNFGVDISNLDAQPHTCRIENRIAADGSNMAWLYLDGAEMGPMSSYFIGSKAQGTTSDWISGRDFVFTHIGFESTPLNNCALEYLQVTECDHTYEAKVTLPVGTRKGHTDYTCKTCGDIMRTEKLDPAAYSGMTLACIGDSITAGVGATRGENDYVTLLAQRLGMNAINLGASGTTLCTGGHRNCNIGQLTEEKLQGADVVTIFMGINDFDQAKNGYYALGDMDTSDFSTIYGAARMWCERITELRQTESLADTQFYFMTPVITSWNDSVTSVRNWDQSKKTVHGYTLRDMCNAIIEVADCYGVSVIDLNLVSGMYYVSSEDNNVAEFGGDGVHPGVAGHAMMTHALTNVLLQNDLRDDHTHSWGSWIITTYPGCSGGEQKRVCKECTAVQSQLLPALGHNFTDGTCTLCGLERICVGQDDIGTYQGGVDAASGSVNPSFTNNWYADIQIPKGAETVRFLTFKTYGNWGSAFLTGNTYISGCSDQTMGGQWITQKIPEGANVLRYGYLYDEIAEQNGLPVFTQVEFFGKDMEIAPPPQFMERPFTGCHSFAVEVNIAPAMGGTETYLSGTDYGYIMLPANYSPYGEATRLIIVCHGAGAELENYQSDAWKRNNYTFWTELGYAVMDMYACPPELSGDNSPLHYGNPVVLECYQKGYEYVMEHFNLRQDGIFLIGSSMGGLSSFQIAQSGQFPVLAQVAYCPVIDLFKQAYCNPWTTASYQRERIARYFGFEGTVPDFTNSKYPSNREIQYFLDNQDKVTAYSPIVNAVLEGDPSVLYEVAPASATAISVPEEEALYGQLTAAHPCPILIFHNKDDSTVSWRYSKYFTEMVQRSGQDACLYTFASGGHNAWANGETVTVQGIHGAVTVKTSQQKAYEFFEQYEQHADHLPWVDPSVAPTCTATGLKEGSHCASCLKILIAQQEIPALGHAYTGDRDGTCDRCGEKRTVYSDLRGSVKSSRDGAVVALSGTAAYETAVLDGTFDFDTVEQGNYDLTVKQAGCLTYTVKGITVGEGDVLLPEIELVAGDVNGDDMINIMDIGAFRENFGMAEEEITNVLTDVNNDGMVNIIDMGIFRRNFGKTAEKDCTVIF